MLRTAISTVVFAIFAVPFTAAAVQTVIYDGAANHTTSAYVDVGAAGAPADLTAPDNFANGTLHHRVIVTTAPTNDMTYGVCFVQGANMACSANTIAISGAGTFMATQAMSSLSNYVNIQWNLPLDDIRVVAMDTAGVPVDATETTWIGSPNFGLYYPMNLTYQAVIVAQGDAFEGFPGMMMGNPAEAPTMSPNGGTFEGSIAVTLASGTADAMIYYTTDGSDPDDASTLYDGNAINITATTTLRAITYATGFDPSPVTSADFTIVAQLSNGLRGRYFDSDSFEGLAMTRTDPVIDFVYPDGNPPAPDIGGTYSILWTGQVTPRYSDTYTFKTVNDDGARLWINDQLIIDDWNYHGPQERTGTIALTANQPVSVWLEYFNGGGEGTIRLSWESAQQPDEVIPDTAMVPNLPAGQQPVLSLFPAPEDTYPESYAEPIVFELRRRGNLDAAVNATLTWGGTATLGEDFTAPTTVSFPANQMAATVEVTILNDMLVDREDGEDETVIVTIADGAYQVSQGMQEFTITDDDVLVDSISGTITYTGTESGSIIVEAFRETDPVFAKRTVKLLNPGPYQLLDLEEGDYTVIAYIDNDDDERLGDGEIWGIYQGGGTAPVLVTIPPGQTGIDINLDIAPGEAPGEEDDGCCATIAGPRRGTAGWLALMLGAVVVALRRRRAQPL